MRVAGTIIHFTVLLALSVPAMAQTVAMDAAGAPETGLEAPGPTPADDDISAGIAADVAAAMSAQEDLAAFIGILEKSGLDAMLKAPGPYTIFAPVDRALAVLPAGMLDLWMKPVDRKALRDRAAYHIVPRRLDSLSGVEALKGGPLAFTGTGEPDAVNGVRILEKIDAANGTVYKIDGVLAPPAQEGTP